MAFPGSDRLLTIAAVSSALLAAGAGVADTTPGQIGAPSPRPAAASAAPHTTLDVLTFNAFLRPFLPERQNERMPLMAGQLAGYDVLLLQELFSDWHRGKLLKALRKDYPYQSRVLGRDRGLGQDGGVVIVSKWPIERQFQRLFGADCAGKDCFAEKGVLYARINKQGRRIHLFATHLQSGARQTRLRNRQLATIKRLIDRMRLPADEPVLIGGDLNVDRLGDATTGAFAAMARILDAAHPRPVREGRPHDPTIDPARNRLADDATPQCIDYVLYSEAHLKPVDSYNAVRPVAAEGRPLSDHFAVHGHFVFEAASRPPGPGTFPFVEFFDGNGGQGDFICNVALEDGLVTDLGALPECGGTRLRSLRLHDVPAGRAIRFYGRSGGGAGARPWTEVRSKRFIASRRFESFEINLDNSDLRATYFGRDGLDGRVGRIEVSAASPPSPAALR